MKKILSYIFFGVLALATLTGCSDEESYPTPTALDPSTLSFEAKPGAVKLKWEIPENANYKYVKVTYTLPDSGKECMRLASVYSDTLLVDNLLKRYGEIVYTLQPCSADGKGGEICSITAQADAVPKTVKTTATPINITGTGDAWTDDQETQEGPLKDLFDDDEGTFFHMSWSSPTPFPHYIVVDMKQEVSTLRFSYTCRNNANCDNPREIDVLISNELGDTPDYQNETGTTLIASLTGLSGIQKAFYESDNFIPEKKGRYVWFKVKSSTSGSDWISLAELKLYKVKTVIDDPENDEYTIID